MCIRLKSLSSGAAAAALLLVAGCAQPASEEAPEAPKAPESATQQVGVVGAAINQDAVVTAYRDTYVKELSSVKNFGTETSMRVQGLDRQRSVVQFNQAQLVAAANGRAVVAAELELTVLDVAWVWGQISAHRLKSASTEGGATWSCANDTNVGNFWNDCTSANAWQMSALFPSNLAYVSTASASVNVSNSTTVVRFDVTNDVKAFLAGTQANHGWLVKAAIEGIVGGIRFRTRESGTAPRLILDLAEPACVATAPSDVTCDGIDDDCSGTADEDFVAAATSCGLGACAAAGATSCVAGAVVDSCAPGAPAADDASCDGIDDDCNGATDEGFVAAATSCGLGACAAVGATSCVAGAVVDSCAPGAPAADDASCDGIDNDCNGIADEGFVAAATACGSGACAASGSLACVAGSVIDTCIVSCEGACDDTVDDDNDNTVDCADSDCAEAPECNAAAPGDPCEDDSQCQGYSAQGWCITEEMAGFPGGYCTAFCADDSECPSGSECVTGLCAISCDIEGACALGTSCFVVDEDGNDVCLPTCDGPEDCSGGRSCLGGFCQAECTPTGGDDDTCDGNDDDCDGAVDESAAGGCGCTATGSDEDCNGSDDDCDGAIDEGFVSVPTTCGPVECESTGATSCVDGVEQDSCVAQSECLPSTFYTIETFSAWNYNYIWSQLCGEGFVGQTFTLGYDSDLDILTIYARTTPGSDPLTFRVEIYAWDENLGAPTGAPLYTSPDPVTTGEFLQSFSYGLAGTQLQAGKYVFVINSYGLGNGPNAYASFGEVPYGTDAYPGGTQLFSPECGAGGIGGHNWYAIDADLAFSLSASTVLPPAEQFVGQPCSQDIECGSGGYCVDAVPGGYCAYQCDNSQPAGEECAPGHVCVYDATCVLPCNADDTCDDPRLVCGDYTASGYPDDKFCNPTCLESCVNGGTCNPVTRFCE